MQGKYGSASYWISRNLAGEKELKGAELEQIQAQMRSQSSLLVGVNGILVGDMLGADDGWEEGDFHLSEVLEHYARLTGKPMIRGLPAGHGKDNAYLPLGIHAVMQANEDGTASLWLDEAVVQAR